MVGHILCSTSVCLDVYIKNWLRKRFLLSDGSVCSPLIITPLYLQTYSIWQFCWLTYRKTVVSIMSSCVCYFSRDSGADIFILASVTVVSIMFSCVCHFSRDSGTDIFILASVTTVVSILSSCGYWSLLTF